VRTDYMQGPGLASGGWTAFCFAAAMAAQAHCHELSAGGESIRNTGKQAQINR